MASLWSRSETHSDTKNWNSRNRFGGSALNFCSIDASSFEYSNFLQSMYCLWFRNSSGRSRSPVGDDEGERGRERGTFNSTCHMV